MVVNGVFSAVIIAKMIFGKLKQLKSLPLRRGPSVKKHRSRTLKELSTVIHIIIGMKQK